MNKVLEKLGRGSTIILLILWNPVYSSVPYAFGAMSKKPVPNLRWGRFVPGLSLKFHSLALMLRSLIHLELNLYIVWGKVQHHSFACGYPVVPAPFVDRAILSSLNSLNILVKNQLTFNLYFWNLNSILLICMSILF